MVYLYYLKTVDINIEDTRSVPLETATVSFVATAALLYSMWRWTGHFKNNTLV
jgi:uncharacterized protein